MFISISISFRPLGALQYMRLWHDNSGKGKFAGWYLKFIIVRDLQTREKFHFIANRWFAVEEDDGQVIDTINPIWLSYYCVPFENTWT